MESNNSTADLLWDPHAVGCRHRSVIIKLLRLASGWRRLPLLYSIITLPVLLLRIDHTTKPNGSCPIASRGHQQILLVLIESIRLWKVPNRSARPIGGTSTNDGCPRM